MKREITLVECYQRAMREVESSRLTMAMRLAGNAMSPTLNFGVASGSVGEAVLVRKLVSARGRVFVGDVVAFRSPADSRALLVRRIAALEGHDMESSDPAEEGFRIPQGHCWVASDNQELPAKDAVDSRKFGPLPLQSIVGRAVYSLKSSADHRTIENSEAAIAADEPVLEHELDIEELKEHMK